MEEEFTLIVDKITPGGSCLGHYDGKAVFVPLALPGERLRVQAVKVRKKFVQAEILEIMEASDKRVDAECPYYGQCGGCNLMHTSYDNQLNLKKDMFTEAFRNFPEIAVMTGDVYPSIPWCYRNRFQIHSAKNGIGFSERKSNHIIPVSECRVADKGFNTALQSGVLRFSEGKRKTLFACKGEFYLDQSLEVEISGNKLEFYSDHFFQSNLSILDSFIDVLKPFVSGRPFYDLYAGCGLFSVCLGDSADLIIGVEEFGGARKWYLKNTKRGKAHFFSGSVEKWIETKPEIRSESVILVDPPRTGLSFQVRKFLGRQKNIRLIYVSCDYITQARDTSDLVEAGFHPVFTGIFDFSPQTSRMETIIVYEKE